MISIGQDKMRGKIVCSNFRQKYLNILPDFFVNSLYYIIITSVQNKLLRKVFFIFKLNFTTNDFVNIESRRDDTFLNLLKQDILSPVGTIF